MVATPPGSPPRTPRVRKPRVRFSPPPPASSMVRLGRVRPNFQRRIGESQECLQRIGAGLTERVAMRAGAARARPQILFQEVEEEEEEVGVVLVDDDEEWLPNGAAAVAGGLAVAAQLLTYSEDEEAEVLVDLPARVEDEDGDFDEEDPSDKEEEDRERSIEDEDDVNSQDLVRRLARLRSESPGEENSEESKEQETHSKVQEEHRVILEEGGEGTHDEERSRGELVVQGGNEDISAPGGGSEEVERDSHSQEIARTIARWRGTGEGQQVHLQHVERQQVQAQLEEGEGAVVLENQEGNQGRHTGREGEVGERDNSAMKFRETKYLHGLQYF